MEEVSEEVRVCIVGHGREYSVYALTKLAESLGEHGIILVDSKEDATEIINIKYESVPQINFTFDNISRYDEDDKYNWRDVELNRSIYHNSRILNTSLNSIKNKRNIFKNKRR